MESLKELYEWFLEAEEEDEEEDDEEPSEATEDSSNSTLKRRILQVHPNTPSCHYIFRRRPQRKSMFPILSTFLLPS